MADIQLSDVNPAELPQDPTHRFSSDAEKTKLGALPTNAALQTTLGAKADLVNGKVNTTQLVNYNFTQFTPGTADQNGVIPQTIMVGGVAVDFASLLNRVTVLEGGTVTPPSGGGGVTTGGGTTTFASPTDLSDLAAWYQASGIVQSGNAVQSWTDSSSNGRTLTSGSSKPIYNATGLNNLATVRSTGVEAMISASNFPSFAGLSVYVVGKQAATDGQYGRFIDAKFDTGFHISRDNTNAGLFGGGPTSAAPNGSIVALANDTFKAISLRSGGPNGNSILSVGTTAGTTYANGPGPSAPGLLRLFAAGDGSEGMKEIAEVVIYTRLLSDAEHTNVLNYLTTKYAL